MRTPSRHAPPIHEALQAARKAAGFDTSAAAAAHFGWSVGRYRSHESGARNIPDADISVYAKSFKVSATSIHSPDPQTIDRQLDKARNSAQAPRQEVARRLRCARILRGLPSAIVASRKMGIKTPTYLKHENGANGISDGLLEEYARELAVSSDWLSTGRLPSGLGADLDSRIHQVLRDPSKFARLAEVSLPFVHENQPPPILDTGRPVGVVAIPEYLWSDLLDCSGDISRAIPHGVVQLPKSADLEYWEDGLFSIFLDTADPRPGSYSRLFVARALASDFAETEYLVADGRNLEIVRLDSARLARVRGLVGRLVGSLQKSPSAR
ncbi:hypothetical protein V1286_007627 [Bradyrhizobium algeriense]|uniref:HTH cro/C1-type domain-containing protein n=1 Tax=Bradyrhizobium algeriense TaxID=634784 RepID=A0ABU8BNH1_9BRAD